MGWPLAVRELPITKVLLCPVGKRTQGAQGFDDVADADTDGQGGTPVPGFHALHNCSEVLRERVCQTAGAFRRPCQRQKRQDVIAASVDGVASMSADDTRDARSEIAERARDVA